MRLTVRVAGTGPKSGRLCGNRTRWLAEAAVLAAYGLFLYWQPGGARFATAVDALGQLTAAVVAAVLAAITGRRSWGIQRYGWISLAIGLCAWAGGEVIVAYFVIVLNSFPPLPGVPDLGFLLFPVAASVGLWLIGGGRRIGAKQLTTMLVDNPRRYFSISPS
jgi:hypothetical protein